MNIHDEVNGLMSWNDGKCPRCGRGAKHTRKERVTGTYQPYRDTLETERYEETIIVLKCLNCKLKGYMIIDEDYHMEETDMQKYGYKGANYGQ